LPTSTDAAAKAFETPTSTDAAAEAFETQDLVKRFEDVEAVKGTNLETEERVRIVVHNGSPFLPTSTDAAAKAFETPTSTDAAVKASEGIFTKHTGREIRAQEATSGRPVVNKYALKTEHLTKKIENLTIVDDLNLEIKQKEVFGFLGPNGAGKTTSIKMMVGLLKPTSGRVLFDGAEAGSVDKSRIGVCQQEHVQWDALTCRENLTFMGDMYGIPAPQLQARVNRLLDLLSLTEKADQNAAKLSGGTMRRLNIALALVNDPEILFLDEPSAGLDPQSRLLLWDVIRSLRDEEGKTIVLTTHALEEADALSDRIAIIDHGKLLGLDTPEGLKKTLGKGDIVELQLLSPAMNQEMLVQIRSMNGIEGAYELNGKIAVRALDAASKLPKIINLVEGAGGRVEDISVRRNSLEDVFISLTGRTLRD
jgi:ABC-2 type transport system ATP-binding protein